MAALKWKRKGLKLKRRPFTGKDIKDWVKGEGKDILLQVRTQLRLRWIFGKRRARRILYKQQVKQVNKDKPFRLALREHLNQLPDLVASVADKLRLTGHKALFHFEEGISLVVVPRALVQNDFPVSVVHKMTASGDLERFPHFPQYLLRKKAIDTEELFFKVLKTGGTHICSDNQGMILGVDTDFDWHLKNIPGHYYVGLCNQVEMDLSTWRKRRRFRKSIAKILRRKKIELSDLNVHEIGKITERFWAK